MAEKISKPEAEWRKQLTREQFEARVRATLQGRRDDQSREPRGAIKDKRVQ